MKKLIYIVLALLAVHMAGCGSAEKQPAETYAGPRFDVAFTTSYNNENIRRADSAYAAIDSLSAIDKAYLALFYAQSSDESFENSQRYMEQAIKAYEAAVADDRAEADKAFEAFGKEMHLSLDDIHAAFVRNADLLRGAEPSDSLAGRSDAEAESGRVVMTEQEVPEKTLEEALEAVQL